MSNLRKTNNNLLFFIIIMYTLIHENNYVYLCIFGSIFYWSLFALFIYFFIIVYNMCSYCKCQMCLFVRYVLLNVILHVIMSVSIFHNFTSLKVLHLFRFDMSTMVVTIQLMVDVMALFIQIFYNCSSNVFFF